jgi:hypothetical protein
MKTDSNLSLANRKQHADMLGNDYHGLRSRMKDKFREKRKELVDSLEMDFAEKKGALKVVVQINGIREKIKEQEEELALLGFELQNDGDLYLTGDAGRALRKTIAASQLRRSSDFRIAAPRSVPSTEIGQPHVRCLRPFTACLQVLKCHRKSVSMN